MSPLLVNLFKVLFVAALYAFLWVVVRAVRSHLGTGTLVTAERQTAPAVFFTAPAEMAGRVIVVEQPVIVGRSTEVEVTVDDPFISDRHLRLDRLENRLVIEDLGSTNGTAVNGVPVVGRRALDRGDVIRIGQTIMEVR
jgi:hypothetical protein